MPLFELKPMHAVMPLRRALVCLVPLVALAACATGPAEQTASPAAPVAEAKSLGDGALFGLYLQGQEAFNEGHRDEAVGYFAEAAKREPDSTELKSQAFIAALLSGDLRLAASLSPMTGSGAEAEGSLGRLTGAVEAIAEGRGADAETLLNGAAFASQHSAAAELLLPWAAAEARDWKTAQALPATDGDHLVDQIALLSQALIYERRGRYPDAEADFRNLIAQGDSAGVNALAYGQFLERRRRKADAS
ncbi:MAG TPA: hypothetical protein VJP88_10440, partial [Caulobacteraceae bacterium]|nr:hypothetical protein [Caulobacteraceae bacterium]